MEKEYHWICFKTSVKGANHTANELPNQDAIKTFPEFSYLVSDLIVCTADGHGSNNCPRSDIGAKIAVQVSVNELSELVNAYNHIKGTTNIELFIKSFAEKLPRKIIWQWRETLKDYHSKNPFESSDETIDTEVPYKIYGSTLMSALCSAEFLLLMQIGDGNIVIIDKNNNIEYPIKSDEEQLANYTYSISSNDAEQHYHFKFLHSVEDIKAIIISTDGFYNSFIDRESYQSTILKLIDYVVTKLKNGEALIINKELTKMMESVTSTGSGDDISLCIILKGENI